jgi:hypothetical protein
MLVPVIPLLLLATPVPVVVELFTSEGCSSCPAADVALAQLEREQPVEGAQIVALGLHVDYWNNLGWADPFSSPAWSRRQEQYSDAFGGDRIYTPQMVIDGQRELLGSSSRALGAIRDSAKQQKAKVTLSVDGERVHVSIDSLASSEDSEIMLAITEGNLVSRVTRGENSGETLRHAAVVRSCAAIGEAKAGRALDTKLEVATQWRRDALKVVAFVQEKKSRRILGAAAVSLTPRS